jgi:hypothetical protein
MLPVLQCPDLNTLLAMSFITRDLGVIVGRWSIASDFSMTDPFRIVRVD